jgi:hypothetical protein
MGSRPDRRAAPRLRRGDDWRAWLTAAFLLCSPSALPAQEADPGPGPPALLPSLPAEPRDAPAPAPPSPAPPSAVEVPAPVLPPPVAPTPVPAPAAAAAVPPDRWFLMREVQGTALGAFLDDNRLSVSGWTNGSFTGSTDRDDQLPMGFNFKANRFLLQQNWVRFERTVLTSGTTEPTFGFRSDWILPGSDYRFTLPRGIFNGQLTANHGTPNTYGIDPIQFYGEAYFPTVARGMDVKVGRFFCLYGVESNEAVSNQLGSRAYSFIYDPFTHTGFVTTTKLTEVWTVQAGAALGNDVFIGPEDNATFLGSVKWTEPDGRNSLFVYAIVDQGRFNQKRHFHNPEVFDLVAFHRFDPRLTYTFEGLYGFTNNVPDIGTANWMGLINYLTYSFSPRLSGTTRLEFFDDFQGQRTGFKGLYTALTGGVNFRLRKDVIFRPELRYDYNNESRPFEDKHSVFTATADMIVRW